MGWECIILKEVISVENAQMTCKLLQKGLEMTVEENIEMTVEKNRSECM